MAIAKEVRQRVRERAKFLCEYCHSSEFASAARFEIDHLQPRSRGGSDEIENLALACQRCNGYRYNFVEGVDPESQATVALFNPRSEVWNNHFCWTDGGVRIRGETPTGRATCDRLDLNDDRHNDGWIMKARRLWLQGGWHPPEGDRQNFQ